MNSKSRQNTSYHLQYENVWQNWENTHRHRFWNVGQRSRKCLCHPSSNLVKQSRLQFSNFWTKGIKTYIEVSRSVLNLPNNKPRPNVAFSLVVELPWNQTYMNTGGRSFRSEATVSLWVRLRHSFPWQCRWRLTQVITRVIVAKESVWIPSSGTEKYQCSP